MAQEPTTERQLQTSQIHDAGPGPAANDEDDDIDEMDLTPPPVSVYDKVYVMAERFAATGPGQFVAERGDRLLEMVEDTAKWSLPQDKSKEEPLVRPFGWVTFLALIVVLRLTRIGLSVAALMIGNGPVSAHDMVYFIQTRRRKLRAIRMHGLKAVRQRQLEEQAMRSSRSASGSASGGGIVGKLRALLSSAICRPGQVREPERRIFIHRGREVVEGEAAGAGADRASTKRPRDDEGADEHNLTFDQLLSKYANENSDDDSDFLPNPDEDGDDDDDGSTSSGTSSDGGSSSSSSSGDEANPEEAKKKPVAGKSEGAAAGKTRLDRSVEITENGGDHAQQQPPHNRPMPRPMVEVKKEVLSDIDSGNEQLAQTPKTNGPSNGGETEAHKENLTPPGPMANGGGGCGESKLQHIRPPQPRQLKSTPGHDSAAQTKPAAIPALGATATAAPPNNDERPQSPCPLTPTPTPPTPTPNSSPTLTPTPSPTPSSPAPLRPCPPVSMSPMSPPPPPPPREEELDVVVVADRPPALRLRCPSPSDSTYETLTSASSTEDVFYSPIGSPPDFDACFKPVSILKNPLVAATENDQHADAHSTPKSDPKPEPEDSESATGPKKPAQPQNPAKQQQQQHQHQQHHQNRYRGKNRR